MGDCQTIPKLMHCTPHSSISKPYAAKLTHFNDGNSCNRCDILACHTIICNNVTIQNWENNVTGFWTQDASYVTYCFLWTSDYYKPLLASHISWGRDIDLAYEVARGHSIYIAGQKWSYLDNIRREIHIDGYWSLVLKLKNKVNINYFL